MRQRLIGLIWTLTFGGMQWRIAGGLSGVPFTTLHSSFARWTRLGLWRRLGRRLALDWRLARGDEVLPSAAVGDSRSLRSAPTAWARGIDWAKLVKGIEPTRPLQRSVNETPLRPRPRLTTKHPCPRSTCTTA